MKHFHIERQTPQTDKGHVRLERLLLLLLSGLLMVTISTVCLVHRALRTALLSSDDYLYRD